MNECKHPPERYYCWTAWDGTLCIGCCDCGEVLRGAYDYEEEKDNDNDHKRTKRQMGQGV